MSTIAIIGMACRYAEARSPRELWENVLAQRRSFRRIPRVRLNLADYSAEAQSEDRITAVMAAVLDDYEFDRARFHISQDTFQSTDLSHWLALDVAAQALGDARLLQASAGQRERTGVYIGNSLTGEFSRANLLRLRWPYVRRVLAAAFEKGECRPSDVEAMLGRIEDLYKAPFPPTNEDSLAGGLSNTIAGRICNYFDLKGGGYTVDGACASSLLAIATACSALTSGDVDVAVAGGVDLSLDPFELAGFSTLGALARDKMRVFDARSSGFWPGEGCGAVVLMRHEDAVAQQHTPYALIRGWGISSDGNGGITRPEIAGQSLALRRAYERAAYGMETVAYFEGHGTGTAIGDAVELQALSELRRDSGAGSTAAVGSIKANIGHTKAAAGVAGLMKAAMAVHAGILPPTTGCDSPHPQLADDNPALRVLNGAELWPADTPARAGVSGFGFGGINVHVTLESAGGSARRSFTAIENELASSPQDCELFMFAAAGAEEFAQKLDEVLAFAEEMSFSELADLSSALARKLDRGAKNSGVRGACIAATPDELKQGLLELCACCENGVERKLDLERGVFFLGSSAAPPRVGFLFPGQASPVYTNGGMWSRRFPSMRGLYDRARLPKQASVDTQIAQPCIVTASIAGLRILELFGIQAAVAVGHSLGEITALHWAGACNEDELLRLVRARGRIMAEMGEPSGAMASIRADYSEVTERLNGDRVVVAARNAPQQTVVSGEAAAVRRFTEKLRKHGFSATLLPVSHAFHSPLVAGVASAFFEEITPYRFKAPDRRVISTVVGHPLDSADDLKQLLAEQITRPVQFVDAVQAAAEEVDLFFEVGPGTVLSGIARECTDKPVLALDSGSESLRGLFSALGAVYCLGGNLKIAPLYEKRFSRPVEIKKRHVFLANPCETVPESAPLKRNASRAPAVPSAVTAQAGNADSAQEVLLQLVAERTKLPLEAIKPESRFLRDLHLNSITISQLLLEAAGRLSLPAPVSPAEYTNATVAEAAATLELLRGQGRTKEVEAHPAGVDTWTRVLAVELVEKPLRRASAPASAGTWEIVTAETSPLEAQLREEFRAVAGHGVVCCVPLQLDEPAAGFLIESAQMALERGRGHVVFVQHRGGASALARTLFLENPEIKVTVVNAPLQHPEIGKWAAAEARANRGFMEAYYDEAGTRREPRLKLLWPQKDAEQPGIAADDLLLVTGGGKGIATESALQLAKASGCRLALLGRSDPEADRELAGNLRRFREAGVNCRYFAADITDAEAVTRALSDIQAELGAITAVLHGAGANHPTRLEEITRDALLQTLRPKITGLENLLAQIDPDKLRLLVTFGSIIGRTGLHGEAHYGLANEWLNMKVERWAQEHPHCRCLNLEWSVWGGIGMGQRLGVLDSLVRQGITPLPVDEAIEQLQTVLSWQEAPTSAIITGRFGGLPTLRFEQPELPLLRFLERTRIHNPGIELVAEAELSSDTDPYVAEHAFQGEQLVPAVMGMEAMAQVAMALENSEQPPEFRELRFDHPIVVPKDKPVTVRVAVLRRAPGVVAAVVRCSSTGFQVEHFSGVCVFGERKPSGHSSNDSFAANSAPLLLLDPKRDLYGRILFHQGRFQRVEGYRLLHAAESIAQLAPAGDAPWFRRHLPPQLILGDAASRDAALHSIQGCIPHKTVLPVGIEQVLIYKDWTAGGAVVLASERLRDGDNFIYDLRVENARGELCEEWRGLELRAVAEIERKESWPIAVLTPYLERKLQELLSREIKIGLGAAETAEREYQSNKLLRELLGTEATLTHRLDGKPEVVGLRGGLSGGFSGPQPGLSLSHCGEVTLLGIAGETIGCDLERIESRDPGMWERMLGAEGFALARRIAANHVSLDCAATQVWTLKESLRKAGAACTQAMSLCSVFPDGWAVFCSSQQEGALRAATVHTRLRETGAEVAFGFLTGGAR
jgi:enediyne polyketide synthase